MNYSRQYLSIKHSFGLLGVVILVSLLLSPIIIPLKDKIDIDAINIIYYITTAIPLIYIFTKVKRKYSSKLLLIKKPKLSILAPTLICGITLTFGVIFPLNDLIPMPDFLATQPNSSGGILTFFLMVIIAPVCEEYFYRGVILDGLLRHYKPIISILISSIIFGLAHLNPWQFIAGFMIGCLAGYIYHIQKNLIITILLHSTVNLIGYIQILYINAFQEFESYIDVYNELGNAYIIIGLCIITFISCLIYILQKNHAKKDGS